MATKTKKALGSLILDRKFRKIGRLKKASGTSHARTFARMNEMLTQLYEQGRHDLLLAIRDGDLAPLEVYAAWRSGTMDRLPTADMLKPLASTMREWAKDYECSDDHRDRTLLQAVRYFEKRRPDAKVGDLPAVLEELRTAMKGKTPVSFNRTRSAAQAFVRSTLKRSHRLYAELQGVEALPVTEKRAKHPQPIAMVAKLADQVEALAIADERAPGWGGVVWAMALTGMGPKEFHGVWSVAAAPDRVHIVGTKREARVRDVPLVWRERFEGSAAVIGGLGRDRFYKILLDIVTRAAAALEIHCEPYDFRRSYANYLEAAGIPRTRRRLYRGHASQEVGDEYEWHEVAEHLAADAEKLRTYLTAELTQKAAAVQQPGAANSSAAQDAPK